MQCDGMKGYRFYAEYPSGKAKLADTQPHGNPKGLAADNVIAVLLDDSQQPLRIGLTMVETISALTSVKNSNVCSGAASTEYLGDICRRVSEKDARRIHPNLFDYLEE